MRRSFFFILTFCLIGLPILPAPLLTRMPFLTSTTTIHPTRDMQTTTFNANSARLPGPDLAITNWTSNRIGNPGFETWSTPTYADRWDPAPSGDQYAWFATQPPWQVSQGTYSGGLQCRSPSGQFASAYWRQSGVGADMQNLTLTFDWYLDQNQDPINNYFQVYLPLTNGTNWYTLYYWLNGTSLYSNSTGNGVYEIGGPSQQWNTFSRNVTQDFLDIPTFPGSVSSTLECTSIHFNVQSLSATSEHLRGFTDDVYMENESTTWIGGVVRDGNFESGISNFWQTSIPARDASYFGQSASAYSGTWCGNLTAFSTGNESYCWLGSFPDCRITAQNPGILSFWWNLEHQNPATGSQSYIEMEFHNGTTYQYVYYLIGAAGTLSWANTTSGLVLFASGYNTTGTWMYFEQNIWADAGAYFGTGELYITFLSIQTRASAVDARIVTLFDDMRLEAGAVNGAGFEDQRAVGTPIRGLTNPYWEYSVLTVTDSAFSGNKAANLTLEGPGGIEFEQELNWRPIDSSQETYLDVMWRLEDFTSTPNDYAYIALYFDDGHYIRYYFAAQTMPSNSGLNCYFNITRANTMNSWLQMHRDLVHDYEEAFGSLPDTEITHLWIRGASSGGNRLEFLFDDLYLYDDPAPILDDVMLTPGVPVYDQAVQVDVEVKEQDPDTITLIYRVNSGVFNFVTMTHHTGEIYRAIIPGQAYNALVEYFFQANDTWGMLSELKDGLAYFSYTVADQQGPDVSIDAPSSGAEVMGTVDIDVSANDEASGMGSVEFTVAGAMVNSDSSAPYSYSWDSTTVADGSVTITVTAYDNDGNQATDSITISVANGGTVPPPPPIPGFPFEAIGLALVIVIGFGLLRRRRRD